MTWWNPIYSHLQSVLSHKVNYDPNKQCLQLNSSTPAHSENQCVFKQSNMICIFIMLCTHCSDLFITGANRGVYKSSEGNVICYLGMAVK